MNTENFKKWLDALRSGKYEQGKHTLRDGDQFCCLGVACDVAKEDLGVDWVVIGEDIYAFEGEDRIHASLPPSEVYEWLGIEPWNYNVPVGTKMATGLNDDEGRDFNYIADALEETYLK